MPVVDSERLGTLDASNINLHGAPEASACPPEPAAKYARRLNKLTALQGPDTRGHGTLSRDAGDRVYARSAPDIPDGAVNDDREHGDFVTARQHTVLHLSPQPANESHFAHRR